MSGSIKIRTRSTSDATRPASLPPHISSSTSLLVCFLRSLRRMSTLMHACAPGIAKRTITPTLRRGWMTTDRRCPRISISDNVDSTNVFLVSDCLQASTDTLAWSPVSYRIVITCCTPYVVPVDVHTNTPLHMRAPQRCSRTGIRRTHILVTP